MGPQDFKLTYHGKGTVVHFAGFRLRPSSNTEFDAHIDAVSLFAAWSSPARRTTGPGDGAVEAL